MRHSGADLEELGVLGNAESGDAGLVSALLPPTLQGDVYPALRFVQLGFRNFADVSAGEAARVHRHFAVGHLQHHGDVRHLAVHEKVVFAVEDVAPVGRRFQRLFGEAFEFVAVFQRYDTYGHDGVPPAKRSFGSRGCKPSSSFKTARPNLLIRSGLNGLRATSSAIVFGALNTSVAISTFLPSS